jgi:hypothetical protein
MIKAKPVVPDQYWILTDVNGKVGNIQAQDGGYSVTLRDRRIYVEDLPSLRQALPVDFEVMTRSQEQPPSRQVHGYPTTSDAYNPVWDAQRQIPMWTTEPQIRSWLAAGWYRLKLHRTWRWVLCPKKILLDRYEYQGPFREPEDSD